MNTALGFSWPDVGRTGIELSDAFHLLVFVRDGVVVRYGGMPFGLEGVDEPISLKPGEAVFEVEERGDMVSGLGLRYSGE